MASVGEDAPNAATTAGEIRTGGDPDRACVSVQRTTTIYAVTDRAADTVVEMAPARQRGAIIPLGSGLLPTAYFRWRR